MKKKVRDIMTTLTATNYDLISYKFSLLNRIFLLTTLKNDHLTITIDNGGISCEVERKDGSLIDYYIDVK